MLPLVCSLLNNLGLGFWIQEIIDEMRTNKLNQFIILISCLRLFITAGQLAVCIICIIWALVFSEHDDGVYYKYDIRQ